MASPTDRLKSLLGSLYSSTYTNPVVARARLVLQRLDQEYHEQTAAGLKGLLEADLRELRVLDGPFKGLRYPSASSLHSCLLPKLLGTYEAELHDPIERLLRSGNYGAIVDVGVAEGYYAVGFAMRCPEARVFAYDIDPISKEMVFEMARTNGVADRVQFGQECTGMTLVELTQQFPRGLLISDSEGYELELLHAEAFAALARWDMLIETHDSLGCNITKELQQRARGIHRVSVIGWRRRAPRDYTGGDETARMISLAAMDEGRTWRSKWLCCESLSSRA
jgi:hypothetical protein